MNGYNFATVGNIFGFVVVG